MSIHFVIAALLPPLAWSAVTPSPARPPTRSRAMIARMPRSAMKYALQRRAKQPLASRLAYWSAMFMGTPYWVPPSEATAPTGLDFRRVDCESYVEQVMALSLSRSWNEVTPTLRRIRFWGGRPGPTRRHFTVVKGWLAANQQAGFLQDITRKIGGSAVQVAHKRVTPATAWRPDYLRRYVLLGARAPRGTAQISYIPIRKAMYLGRRIPSGTLIHVVAAPHPRTPYLVTHVGFAIRTRYGLVFRHASESPGRRQVEDRHFGSYLLYISRTPSGPEMRTGIGIHLSAIRQPTP